MSLGALPVAKLKCRGPGEGAAQQGDLPMAKHGRVAQQGKGHTPAGLQV